MHADTLLGTCQRRAHLLCRSSASASTLQEALSLIQNSDGSRLACSGRHLSHLEVCSLAGKEGQHEAWPRSLVPLSSAPLTVG